MFKRPSFQDGVASLLVMVATISTPMAYVGMGAVDAMLFYPLYGWTFVFGCVRNQDGILTLVWPHRDPRFPWFLTLTGIWISSAVVLAVIILFVRKLLFLEAGVVATLALQIFAPLLLLTRSPTAFVIPFPIPSAIALIGLLSSKYYSSYGERNSRP
ncbi:MAG: hypothetical protein ACFFER_13540 [Candidatus Thorarchaeota archaeon]